MIPFKVHFKVNGIRLPELIVGIFLLIFSVNRVWSQSFASKDIANPNNPTSLQVGPDNRLYVAQQNGMIYVHTVERGAQLPGNGVYTVTATETIDLIKFGTPNHNDDGTYNNTTNRQVTGLLVIGTAQNPVIYVTSSDWRIAVGNDSGLDTNSGVITELSWNGSSWDRVDIVRGLPRCEENHSINGLAYDEANNDLYVMQGGHANKAAPSNNFSGSPEYWYSAALLRVDLDVINAMPVYTDLRYNQPFKYDLPTLNDPSRADIDNTSPVFPYAPGHPLYNATIDVDDPFGGNNSLNQAFEEPGSPVTIFSPGYRNAYDVVITQNGRIYSSDNGPNGGWGGMSPVFDDLGNPQGFTDGNALPAGWYITNELSETNSTGNGDPLHFIGEIGDADGTYYGGHVAPTRAFPEKSLVVEYIEQGNGNWVLTNSYVWSALLSGVSGYYNTSFSLANFPDDPRQAVYASAGATPGAPDVKVLDVVNASTNGITEYVSSAFLGAWQGNLITASYNGNLNIYTLNAAGDTYIDKEVISVGGQSLDVTCPADGVMWAGPNTIDGCILIAKYGGDKISVLEPDQIVCYAPGDASYDGQVDYDGDGFTSDDEINNYLDGQTYSYDHCNGADTPNDNDLDGISDWNDPDDDNDGINDINDPFALDPDNGLTTDLPVIYPFWNNDPGTGLFGLGFTGLMNDGATDYMTQYRESELAFGGAAGKAAIEVVTAGDALAGSNTQENGFQFGINVDVNSNPFTVHAVLEPPYFDVGGNQADPVSNQSYGIQIGAGDQDNYLKLVLNGDNGSWGFEVLLETGGSASGSQYGPTDIGGGDIPGAGEIDLYFSVDPPAGTAQPFVSIDGGQNIYPLGAPVSLPVSWLSASDDFGLAVGLISTSGSSGIPFGATWDYLFVTEDQPGTLTGSPNPLDFGNVTEGTSPVSQQVNLINEGGAGSGSIFLTGVTITGPDADDFSFVGSLPGDIAPGGNVNLDIQFTPDNDPGAKTATMEIAHSGSNSPLLVSLEANVLQDNVVLYRVNAGGVQLAALDSPNPDWDSDTNQNPSPYRTNGDNASNTSANSIDGSVPVSAPAGIWTQERWDPTTGGEMMWDFPASTIGNYTVRLYFLNNCTCTQNIGQRVFDVEIEGVVQLDDYDIVADVGHKVATMKEFVVFVGDGNLDIDFQRVEENPLINAIEILGPGTSGCNDGLLSASPSDQLHFFTTEVGATSDPQSITIGNDGNAYLEITNVALSGPDAADFAHDFTGVIGVPVGGAGQTIDITFSPTSDGGRSATLEIYHDGCNTSPYTILLTGEAYNPGTDVPIYRVNCGGPLVSSPLLDWDNDQATAGSGQANGSAATGTPSPYLLLGGNYVDKTYGATVNLTNNTGYPDDLFFTERYSDATNPDNMSWEFPATTAGVYEVNLLFAEIWGQEGSNPRVFDVEIEGILVLDDYRASIAANGVNIAVVETFNINVTDGTLDIDFLKGTQNPALKGIEIITPDGTSSDAIALIQVLPGSGNINASTYGNGSFEITNQSAGGQKINSVTFDMSTGFLPNMVFDPDGTAGDQTSKGFQEDQGVGGTTTAILGQPYGNGGYQQLDISFTDFSPGETFTFSIDQDPTSIEGLGAPGPNESGSVSGLEQVASTVTVNFDDGSSYTTTLYSDGSNAGATATARADLPGAPVISAVGLTSPAVTNQANQTIEITGGPSNGSISLLQVEAGFFEGGGDLNQEPFEVNSAISVSRTVNISLDASGSASVPVTLTDSDPEAGYHYFVAVVEDGSAFGLVSNVVILEYDEQYTGENIPPLVTNPGNQMHEDGDLVNLQILATDAEPCTGLTYSATGLPPSLTIDPNSGLISGTLDEPSAGGSGAFQEQNGLLVIEMESGAPLPGEWEDINSYSTTLSPNVNDPAGAAGDNFIIWQGNQNLNNPGVGTITYPIEITTPGTYRFQWRNQVGNGTETTEHNDTWLKIEADAFYGQSGGSIVCPNGAPTSNQCVGNLPNGSSSDGWFKIYSSGANNWSWSTSTSDNDAHQIFATFDNPGTYNILVSARSSSHAIDRMVLYQSSVSNPLDLGNPESTFISGGAMGGASENSPYNVTVTVSDGCEPSLESNVTFQWVVNPFVPGGVPSALLEITPGAGLGASTYGGSSIQLGNTSTGSVQISSISIDLSTGILPDNVFDPVGAGGDATSSCFTANSGASAVGLVVPSDPCVDPFSQPRNGGFDIMTVSFSDFDPSEQFNFTVDVDPNSIQGVPGAGNAGAVSGYELIGATVTIQFNDGTTVVSNLFEDGSLGGGQAVVADNATSAPSISATGLTAPAIVNDPNQTIEVTGAPGVDFALLQMDTRLFIESGDPPFDVPDETFYSNEAMSGKVLHTGVIGTGGTAQVPVTLMLTDGPSGTPDGGKNYFIAVTSDVPYAVDQQVSQTSNVLILKYDPDAGVANLDLFVELQGRAGTTPAYSGDYLVQICDPANGNAIIHDQVYSGIGTDGHIVVNGIAPGTYDILVKRDLYLASVVPAVALVAGSNTINYFLSNGKILRGGNANSDNVINLNDFNILASSFGSIPTSGNWNPDGDFNGDETVNLSDFTLLASNYGQFDEEACSGDPQFGGINQVQVRSAPPEGIVTLGFSAEPVVPLDALVPVDIYVDAGFVGFDGTHFEFGFDPSVLMVDEIRYTEEMDIHLLEDLERFGRVELAMGSLSNRPQGKVKVATIMFRTLSPGKTALAFNDLHQVTSDGFMLNTRTEETQFRVFDPHRVVEPDLHIFPNPSSGRFTVTAEGWTGDENAVIEFYDINGRAVHRLDLRNGSTQTVDMSDKASGVLIARWIQDNTVIERSIVITR